MGGSIDVFQLYFLESRAVICPQQGHFFITAVKRLGFNKPSEKLCFVDVFCRINEN